MPRLAELLRQMEVRREGAVPPLPPPVPEAIEVEEPILPPVVEEEEEEEELHHVHVELTSEQLQKLIDAVVPEVMSAEQMARYLQKGRDWVCRMARRGLIPGVKVGNSWRFMRTAVDEWLRGQLSASARDKSRENVNK